MNPSGLYAAFFTYAIAILLFIGCSQTSTVTTQTDHMPSEPVTIAQGNYAPYQPADDEPLFQLIIKSAEEYQRFASQFEQGGFGEPLQEVDFSRHMVAGVWMGESNSSGYSIEITGFEELEDSFRIWVRNGYPDPSCAYLTVITTPFHIAALPRTEKPVTFLFNRVMNSCS